MCRLSAGAGQLPGMCVYSHLYRNVPAAIPAATLEFANLCLKNAGLLLKQVSAAGSVTGTNGSRPQSTFSPPDSIVNGVDSGSNGVSGDEQRGCGSMRPG